MGQVWESYRRALWDLRDPAMWKALGSAFALGVLIFLLQGAGIFYGLASLGQMAQPMVEGAPPAVSWLGPWLDALAALVSAIWIVTSAIFLFPILVASFVGFFLDDVAQAVERRNYPGPAASAAFGIWSGIAAALRFTGWVLLLNLMMTPIYIALLFMPPLNVLVFFLVNGHLLGREYFELAALRHLQPEQARELRRQKRWPVLMGGMVLAGLLSVPFVNILAPIIATAAMVHLIRA